MSDSSNRARPITTTFPAHRAILLSSACCLAGVRGCPPVVVRPAPPRSRGGSSRPVPIQCQRACSLVSSVRPAPRRQHRGIPRSLRLDARFFKSRSPNQSHLPRPSRNLAVVRLLSRGGSGVSPGRCPSRSAAFSRRFIPSSASELARWCLPSVPLLGGNAEVISRPLHLDARFFKLRKLIQFTPAGSKPMRYNSSAQSKRSAFNTAEQQPVRQLFDRGPENHTRIPQSYGTRSSTSPLIIS